jgi:hypothetical protein
MLFDLLWLDGHSLMELPYSERRKRLEQLKLDDERWRTPSFLRPAAGRRYSQPHASSSSRVSWPSALTHATCRAGAPAAG